MNKITLGSILSGYNLNKINDNFQKIEEVINDKLLSRGGESLQDNLDVNGFKLFNLPAPSNANEPARLQDVKNALYGDAGHTANLINFVPQNGIPSTNLQGAVEYVFNRVQDLAVNVKQYGAVGDGITDDTQAFKDMLATGKNWHIPYTPNGYLISDTLTVGADGVCDGFLKVSPAFNKEAITFSNPQYGTRRLVQSLEVRYGSVRVPMSTGIKVNYPNIVLDRCKVVGMDYGIQVCSYGISLLNCVSQLNNTNLSAYAPSPIQEINDLKIIGGNYDSAIEYAARFGDPRFASTVPAGNPHGVAILVQGANFDGAKVTLDRVFAFRISNTYHEGADTGNAIEIGGSGNNNCRGVVIGPACYFSRSNFGIYLNNSVLGLVVEPNYYAVNYSALYAVNCDVSGFIYRKGYANGFNGPEVHTGFTNTTVTALKFSDITIERDFLINGVQIAPNRNSTNNWYPYAKTLDGWGHITSASGRFHNTAFTANGNFVGGAFICANPPDALRFNGGDRVSSSLGSTSFVRYVDYAGGIVYVDGAVLGSGTLSLDGIAAFIGENLSGSGSPEGVITAPKGSLYRNFGGTGGGLYIKDSGSGNTGWVNK